MSTKPVVVAVALTIVASEVCRVAYGWLFSDAALATDSTGSKSQCVEAGQSGHVQREMQARAEPERNGTVSAALFRALVKARVDAEAAQVSESEPAPAGEPDDAEGESPSCECVNQHVAERERLVLKAAADTLDGKLLEEAVDVAWAERTEDAIAHAVAATSNGMRLEAVTCGATFCRARMTHLDPSVRGEDMMQLLRAPEIATQTLAYPAPDDDGATFLYFARQGHTLSALASHASATSSPAEEPEQLEADLEAEVLTP